MVDVEGMSREFQIKVVSLLTEIRDLLQGSGDRPEKTEPKRKRQRLSEEQLHKICFAIVTDYNLRSGGRVLRSEVAKRFGIDPSTVTRNESIQVAIREVEGNEKATIQKGVASQVEDTAGMMQRSVDGVIEHDWDSIDERIDAEERAKRER